MRYLEKGESKSIECKREYSKSILKTVSAFANYHDGYIIIGVDDSGDLIGVDNPDETKLNIENAINDNIIPKPYYEMFEDIVNGKTLIIVKVYSGENTPYVYGSKAYRRADTSTVTVDKYEYENLILKGRNLSYDSLLAETSKDIELEFKYLNSKIREKLDIGVLSKDVMKTLGLIKGEKFTNAAILLSDNNAISNSTISLIRFDDDSAFNIRDRMYLKNISVIEQFDKSIDFFNKHINTREIIDGAYRKTIEEVPLVAYREAIANAIVHRDYLIDADIRVEIFDDRIEIISPGGLPPGISEEEFSDGRISIPRNKIIADVFLRLGIIERLATGIRRIKGYYKGYNVRPKFIVLSNSISVVLPKLNSYHQETELDNFNTVNEGTKKLNENELRIYDYLKENSVINRKTSEQLLGLKKTQTVQILNGLVNKGLLIRSGRGRDTVYRLFVRKK